MNLKTYLSSIIICSLCCSIVSQILTTTRKKALMHLISGVILSITILRPLSQIHLDLMLDVPGLDSYSADRYIADGEMAALELQKKSIQNACEAYILDKADAIGGQIDIRISLNDHQIPVFAEVTCEADPEVQIQLEKILMRDLGIPKENQIWNQETNSS